MWAWDRRSQGLATPPAAKAAQPCNSNEIVYTVAACLAVSTAPCNMLHPQHVQQREQSTRQSTRNNGTNKFQRQKLRSQLLLALKKARKSTVHNASEESATRKRTTVAAETCTNSNSDSTGTTATATTTTTTTIATVTVEVHHTTYATMSQQP